MDKIRHSVHPDHKLIKMVFEHYIGDKSVITPRFVRVGNDFDTHDNPQFSMKQSDDWKQINITLCGVPIHNDPIWGGLEEAAKSYQSPGKATLKLYNGAGDFLEEWTMHEAYPTRIDMQDFESEYQSTEVDINIGIKYKYHTFRCGDISPR